MADEVLNPQNGGQESAVGSQESEGAEGAGESEQQRAYNAAMKAARLQGRQEAESQLKKQYDDTIAGLGVIDPYTGKPFESFAQFQEYGKKYRAEQIKARAEKEGRPAEDVAEDEEDKAFIRQQRKKEAEAAAAEEKKKQLETFLINDIKAFQTEYPDVDIEKLTENPRFKKFSLGRLYKEPLGDIYADYMDFSSETERSALAKAESKNGRSTGAGSTSGEGSLSAAEQKDLDTWNRRYPDLKMTAKEWKEKY